MCIHHVLAQDILHMYPEVTRSRSVQDAGQADHVCTDGVNIRHPNRVALHKFSHS